MGLSSSKSKTEQKTDQTTSGTQTPITPDWLLQGARDYTERIGDFGNMDPNQFVAGASPLQQQAWGNVDQLNGWQPQAATASGLAFGAGTSGPNLATKQPVRQVAQAPQMPQGGQGGPYAPDRNNPFPTPNPQPKGPPRSTELPIPNPQPGLLQPGGYSPAPSMPGYGMPRPGQPIGTENPAITGASQAGAYQNPWDQQVVDTTLAGFDRDAGQRRAQLEASGARNGAFGGSRFGLAEGQFDADTSLGRGALEGGLRQQGFNTANQFGFQDAAAGNQMLQFNAGQQDNALNRQLQAAGLLTDQSNSYDANTRADLGLMAGLGDQQRGIEQDYAGASLAQLQAMGQLSGMTPYDILVGRQVDGTQTGTMTGTTTQKPSLFQQLLQMGQAGAQAYTAGMGGG